MKIKKILLVSYFFPPAQTAASTMVFNFAKYFNYFNWDTIVLCAQKTAGEKVFASFDAPENVSIKRTISPGNMVIYVLQVLKVLSYTYSRIGWFLFAVGAGKRILKKESPDVIISRSTPIVSHLVALKLKKISRLPWIACFSDPWTQSAYYSGNKIIKTIDEYLEKKVMSAADKIIVTTEQTKKLFLEKYKIADKIVVIPNSYDPVRLPNIDKNNKNDGLVITYTGNFYGPRSPEPFFKALQLLRSEMDIDKNIKVKFMGNIEKVKSLVFDYKLNDVVELINTVPRKDIFEYLSNSGILLLIDAPSDQESVFLPSKLLEYINMKKPILAIVPEGASAEVIRATKTGLVVALEDIEGIKNAIKNYYDLYKNGKLEVAPDWNEIKKYDAKNCTEALTAVVENLIVVK